MALLRTLMHLMLCAALILSGSVQALASDAMHAGHAAAKAGIKHTAPGCHESHGDQHGKLAGDAKQGPHGHGDPSDCCTSSNACDCTCQQHSPVTTCLVAAFTATSGDTRVVLPVRVGHAPPNATRSIRPPIA